MATSNVVLFALRTEEKTDHLINSMLIYSQNIFGLLILHQIKGLVVLLCFQFHEIIKHAMLITTMFHTVVSLH